MPYPISEHDIESSRIQDSVATAEVAFSLAQREGELIAGTFKSTKRTSFAKGFCAAVLLAFWKRKAAERDCRWACRGPIVKANRQFPILVSRLAAAAGSLPISRAGFLLGQLYTSLLPDSLRKALGAYYTPPPLVERLLDLTDQSGFDWKRGRVIDPACGGAAFLAFIAPRLVRELNFPSPEERLQEIENRLVGIEIDDFAAWISMVLLDINLLDLAVAAGRRLKPLVKVQDALEARAEEIGRFDLVVGNPPYGKVNLTRSERERFRDSLFGHANTYGVFTELAVHLATSAGLIAFVTPTSFLGGQYFKNLRRLLCEKAPLARLDFVRDRNGVFDGVLQETMLAVFKRTSVERMPTIHLNLIRTTEASAPVLVEEIGLTMLNNSTGNPWLLPRSGSQVALAERLNTMPHRLSDYGFGVSTGQFVWNRHTEQLRSHSERDCYPIIWAEAVNADGTFHFQAERRAHLPYVKIKEGQDFLLNQEPCILVQRTTAKEQKRRLIAAVIPNSFVFEHPGFVVENHLNMLYTCGAKPRVALRTMATLLNSTTLDQAFRCVSGSVAVSAYELNSLPLPEAAQMAQLQAAILAGKNSIHLEKMIAHFYGSSDERNQSTSAASSRPRHCRVAA